MVDYPQRGSIIYIDFDPSISAEIQKRRPAVVISNDILAKTFPFAWVVPISHGSFLPTSCSLRWTNADRWDYLCGTN